MAYTSDGQKELISEKHRISRVVHNCDDPNCDEKIYPTNRYREYVWKMADNTYKRLKICYRCQKYYNRKPPSPLG